MTTSSSASSTTGTSPSSSSSKSDSAPKMSSTPPSCYQPSSQITRREPNQAYNALASSKIYPGYRLPMTRDGRQIKPNEKCAQRKNKETLGEEAWVIVPKMKKKKKAEEWEIVEDPLGA